MSAVKIALFQAQSGIDPAANAERLVEAVHETAAAGSKMLFTPEMSGMLDRDRERALSKARFEADDPVLAAVREAAAQAGIWVHLGSLALRGEGDKLVNRGFVVDHCGEVRARYDKQISETPPTNEIKARHILVKTKEEADAIIKQLDGSADFEKLANEHTTDPSGKTTGGDLGYFAQGQMVPEFETAAFALEVGAYTKQPVQSQFGWHIIKLEESRPAAAPAFEEVKDRVKAILERKRLQTYLEDLRKNAKIEKKI